MHKDLFAPKMVRALEQLDADCTPLQCVDRLRKEFEPQLAREGAQLFELRRRCKPRLGNDLLPFLREPNASQVTAPEIARFRAQYLAELRPNSRIWDSTCGLGMESVQLLRAGMDCVTSDLSWEVARFASANLAHGAGLLGVASPQVLCADACSGAVSADGILMDPDRRPGGKRTHDPERWSPSLARCLEVASTFSAAALKLPPGGRYPGEWATQHRLDWISLDGELLECCLWMGDWAEEKGSRAVRLSPGCEPVVFAGEPIDTPPLDGAAAEEIAFLFDPNPSLVRSGLLGLFASQHGLAPLAPKLGYLGGSEPVQTPFGRCFPVLDSCGLHNKPVKAMLEAFDVGNFEIRMRGHQERPEDLIRRFRGKGSKRGHLAIARLEETRRVYLLGPEHLT